MFKDDVQARGVLAQQRPGWVKFGFNARGPRWVQMQSSKLSDKQSNQVVDLYKRTYTSIGLNPDFLLPGKLIAYYPCGSFLYDAKGELEGALLFWPSPYGYKIGLVVSKSAEVAKKHLLPKISALVKTPGFFVEVSDKLEYAMRKLGSINITDRRVIKTVVGDDIDILSENDLKNYPLNPRHPDVAAPNGSYLREIGGIGVHRKALYGQPCDFITPLSCGKARCRTGCVRFY